MNTTSILTQGEDGHTHHLKQRGDGIKVRHIPVILKYMSEQEKRISIPGYVKPDTIWGFEEPENNLEFKYAFEVAEEIKQYSKDIQIFLTTHSPAFYAIDETNNDGVNTYYVSLNDSACTELKPVSHNDNEAIHDDMGFLPIITPYLEEIYRKDKQLCEAINKVSELEPNSKCYILTEDENQGLITKLFEYSGFVLEEVEFLSYNGAGSIHAAIVLGNYIKTKHDGAIIIIHRDKDYLTDEQLSIVEEKVAQSGLFLFTTIGTDIESCFINSEHILELYDELTPVQVEILINEATQETKEESLKRLINHYMEMEKPQNGDFYGKSKQLEDMYENNTERYRYGKKVLSRLSGKIQNLIGRNCDLTQYTDNLQIDLLLEMSEDIWVAN